MRSNRISSQVRSLNLASERRESAFLVTVGCPVVGLVLALCMTCPPVLSLASTLNYFDTQSVAAVDRAGKADRLPMARSQFPQNSSQQAASFADRWNIRENAMSDGLGTNGNETSNSGRSSQRSISGKAKLGCDFAFSPQLVAADHNVYARCLAGVHPAQRVRTV